MNEKKERNEWDAQSFNRKIDKRIFIKTLRNPSERLQY